MIFGAGCNRMEVTSPYSCAVMVEDTPVNECRLVLLQNLGDEWKPVWEGVSDGKGVVALQPVQGAPVPQGQVELAPLVESIGSGTGNLLRPGLIRKRLRSRYLGRQRTVILKSSFHARPFVQSESAALAAVFRAARSVIYLQIK